MMQFEINDVIAAELLNIDKHRGEEGFKHFHDMALHIVIALQKSGLKIVKAPVRASKK